MRDPDVAPSLRAVLPERVGAIDPAVIARTLSDGDVALFHPDRSAFMSLNAASRWLWEHCDGTPTADELVTRAIATFGWNETDADGAVREVVHQFIARGFVERGATDRLLARNDRPYSATTTQWQWQQRFEMLGVGMVARSNDTAAAEILSTLLAPFESSGSALVTDLVFSIVAFVDGEGAAAHDLVRFEPAADTARFVVSSDSHEAVVMEMLVATNSVAISRSRHFSVHAGAIAVDDEVTMIPATRNAGKSTLVAACLREGFAYVSDEALAIDAQGAVVPYVKPLWLRQWSRDAAGIATIDPLWEPERFKDAIFDASDLGPVVDPASTSLRPTRVVMLDVRPGPAEVSPMSIGDTATVLVANTFDKRLRPRVVFDRCTALAEQLPGWRLSFSDPVDGARVLRREFGRGSTTPARITDRTD